MLWITIAGNLMTYTYDIHVYDMSDMIADCAHVSNVSHDTECCDMRELHVARVSRIYNMRIVSKLLYIR